MTKQQQQNLVRELAATLAEGICDRIAASQVPEAWDGHELRCLFADKAKEAACGTHIRAEPRSARARSYLNACQTRNL